jgi:hypothetical protein
MKSLAVRLILDLSAAQTREVRMMRYPVVLFLFACSTAAAQVSAARPVVFGGVTPRPTKCIGASATFPGLCGLGLGIDLGLGVLISDRAILYAQTVRMSRSEIRDFHEVRRSLDFTLLGLDFFLPATRRGWARPFAIGGFGEASVDYRRSPYGFPHYAQYHSVSARVPAVSLGAGIDIRAGRRFALTPRMTLFQSVGGKTTTKGCQGCSGTKSSVRYKLPTLEITLGWR